MKKLRCYLLGHRWLRKSRKGDADAAYHEFIYHTSRTCLRCQKRQISFQQLTEDEMYFI